MHREQKLGPQVQAARARARAAELDRQARELERSADSGNWRQRARIREAVDRLRLRAGEILVQAQSLEEHNETKQLIDVFSARRLKCQLLGRSLISTVEVSVDD